MAIDRRRNYVIVLDTETANTMQDENGQLDTSNVLAYDIGWQVVDTRGNVYSKSSFVNSDIFDPESYLMQTAYYAKKIPRYLEDLASGKRQLATTMEIRGLMLADMELYNTKIVVAHNARFDYNALNTLIRYVTKSKMRYWFPYGTEFWDTMKMARSVMHKMPTFLAFCDTHGYRTAQGKPRTTAEVLYRYISRNPKFVESHTGLEDVEIETQIMAYCYRQHKAMKKHLFPPKEQTTPPTDLQRKIFKIIKFGA